MNDFERFLYAAPKEGAGEVADLLKEAGPRPDVPAEDFAAIKQAARKEWQGAVALRNDSRNERSPRFALPLALAASLVVALALGWWWRWGATPVGSPVVTVARVEGAVSADGRPLELGAGIAAGVEIETGGNGARVAMRLAGGESVRLDESTRVRLYSGNAFELERGAIYFDSAGATQGAGVSIATVFGTVRDIGTQFEARIDPATNERLRVRVREGMIALEYQGASHSAQEGEELRLAENGDVVIAGVEPFGETWSWVLEAAPPFEIDGRPLLGYLDWVARETGRGIRFGSPGVETIAASVTLRGTIQGLTIDESLDLVLPGSGLEYRAEEDSLVILAAAN